MDNWKTTSGPNKSNELTKREQIAKEVMMLILEQTVEKLHPESIRKDLDYVSDIAVYAADSLLRRLSDG